MSLQLIKKEQIIKRTKPKSTVLVTDKGFDDGEKVVTYEEFFKGFVGKDVSLSLTESSQIDLTEDELTEEGDDIDEDA